ncbi:Xaa-Pro aminopeptidase [Luteitalea sp. TBR-22]|uniref:M24 family metallopeptidase n=1 Tax=Luteitalea sp. TBR-22 TaxID=2802971 RepID=UPI001AF50517|nr:M24 family metallopeptidase [Luteitalea sp. TBR-22]BCS31889.1 Xaa-Pro aminopeptidase [Luteitalea sp. TBR-22]
MRFGSVLLALAVASAPSAAPAPSSPLPPVKTHREQAALHRTFLERRFERLLPELMRRHGLDMWIVVTREYDDDPVFRALAPLTTYASRRRTILVFHDRGPGQGVERLSIGRFDYDRLYTVVPTHNDGQWAGLRALLDQRQPRAIGIDTSRTFAHADGISHTEHEALVAAIGPVHAARLRSAERLAVDWLGRRLPEETAVYREAQAIAHAIIREAFSAAVITPGVTTTDDVAWWMRQRVAELGLGQWFQPTVDIQRKGGVQGGSRVIERGDLLHCDFGIVYLGYATDTQHNAYVPHQGELAAPAGLQAGQRAGTRLQDIVLEEARAGVTGNAALAASLARGRGEQLSPVIYCHPIGIHGHGAGPHIGMTDYQDGLPGAGDYAFEPESWHSIELSASRPVPEWDGQVVRFALEEDAVLTSTGWRWALARQDDLLLVR